MTLGGGTEQVSVSGPLDADELAELRAFIGIEEAEEGGADPAVHGMYDFYETTKRLLDGHAARDIDIERERVINGGLREDLRGVQQHYAKAEAREAQLEAALRILRVVYREQVDRACSNAARDVDLAAFRVQEKYRDEMTADVGSAFRLGGKMASEEAERCRKMCDDLTAAYEAQLADLRAEIDRLRGGQ